MERKQEHEPNLDANLRVPMLPKIVSVLLKNDSEPCEKGQSSDSCCDSINTDVGHATRNAWWQPQTTRVLVADIIFAVVVLLMILLSPHKVTQLARVSKTDHLIATVSDSFASEIYTNVPSCAWFQNMGFCRMVADREKARPSSVKRESMPDSTESRCSLQRTYGQKSSRECCMDFSNFVAARICCGDGEANAMDDPRVHQTWTASVRFADCNHISRLVTSHSWPLN